MNLNVMTPTDAIRLATAVKATDKDATEIVEGDLAKPDSKGKPSVSADDLYTRLLKFIPAPLVGLYLFLTPAITKIGDDTLAGILLIAWVVFMLIMTGVFLKRRGIVRDQQIAVTLFAFLAYAAASPGPSDVWDWYDPLIGTAALAVAAVLLVVYRPDELPDDVIDDIKP